MTDNTNSAHPPVLPPLSRAFGYQYETYGPYDENSLVEVQRRLVNGTTQMVRGTKTGTAAKVPKPK
jgi:hypothetical protein